MNDAVSRTSGEIIVFSDANTFYEEKALLHLIRNFADPKVGMVCGRLTLEKGRYASLTGPELRYWDYEHLLKIMETESGSTMGVVGSIYAVRRVLWQAEPQDTILDDLQVGLTIMRQGYRVVYEAEAVAREVMVSSSRREFSRKIRLVSGGFQTVSRNWAIVTEKPEVAFRLFLHKLLRWLLPLPLLTLFWYAIRSSRQGKPLFLRTILVFLLSPIPEIIYNFIRQKISGKVDIKVRYTAFPFYLIVMNVAALVGFFRFIFNKQPVTWKMTRDDK
jgi:cellulose synthase/poly-beta-1,6-N-acetylglucosamine synthase-like glycosyltransferase